MFVRFTVFSTRVNRKSRSTTGTLVTLVAAICLVPITFGHTIPDVNGNYQLSGIVFYPNGRHAGPGVMMGLSNTRGVNQQTVTDQGGAFRFNITAFGLYRISINGGNDFEATEESIDFQSGAMMIQITLKAKQKPREALGTLDARAYIDIPKESQKLYEDAIKSSDAGKIDRSIDKLKRAIQICPTYGFAYNELAVNYLRLNRVDDAITAIQSALTFLPGHYAPHLIYGIALVRKEDYQGSVRELQLAIEKEGSSPVAHLYLGRALIGLNKYDEAESELKTALRLENGRMVEAHRFLGFVYIRRREKPQAITELETYLKLVPQAGDAPKIKQLIAQLR